MLGISAAELHVSLRDSLHARSRRNSSPVPGTGALTPRIQLSAPVRTEYFASLACTLHPLFVQSASHSYIVG